MAESKQKMASKGATPAAVDVYIKLPSGRTFNIDMLPADTVSQIYDRVAKEEGVSVDRVTIKYTGKVLKKSSTLGYLGVCAETILKAEIIHPKKYSLYVKLESGRTLSLEIENLSPVRYIKDQIETQEDVPPNRQVIKLGDRTLDNPNLRLVDVGITDEAILHLKILDEAPKVKKSALKAKKKTASKLARKGSTGSRGSNRSDNDSDTSDEDDSRDPPEGAASNDGTTINDVDKEAVLGTFDASGRSVEVVFSFDTTGSMYSCLQQVRLKLKETVQRLLQHIPNIRIGIIAHGDFCDYSNYVLKMVDLTSNVDELVKFVEDVPATGGGDQPECYEWVLYKACHMDWSEDSAKALVVIGDCEPHERSYTDQYINWHEQLDLLTGMGVKVYGVKALTNSCSLPFYQELADVSGGAYISFNNFSIIAEMFMAVCYREASDEQFEAFCEEVTQGQEGDTEASAKVKDIQKVLTQLDEQKNKISEEKPKRYVASSWWDPQLDQGSPRYSYNADKDKWTTVKVVNKIGRATSFHTADTAKKTKTRRSFSFRARSRPSRPAESDSSGPDEARPMKKVTKKKGCSVM